MLSTRHPLFCSHRPIPPAGGHRAPASGRRGARRSCSHRRGCAGRDHRCRIRPAWRCSTQACPACRSASCWPLRAPSRRPALPHCPDCRHCDPGVDRSPGRRRHRRPDPALRGVRLLAAAARPGAAQPSHGARAGNPARRRHRNAQLDRLTGVYNRETLLAMLFRETDRVQRMNSAMCLVLFDIDDFGHWNSRLGVDACDELLCQVATRTGPAAQLRRAGPAGHG